MAPECRLCGVNLAEQDNPLARLTAWPPMLVYPLPTKDEMCRQCQTKIDEFNPRWQITGPGSFKL
jgi:hypothetical protein